MKSNGNKLLARLGTLRTYFRLQSFDTSTEKGRSDERYRRIALTSVSSLAAKVVQSLGVLLTVPLTLGYLGLERYGLWMTVSTSILFLNFADFGIGLGLLNAITNADGRGDKAAAATAVSSAFFTLCTLAVFALAGFALLSWSVNWADFFGVSAAVARAECAPTAWALAVCVAAGLPLSITLRVMQGYQDGLASNIVQLCGNLVGFVGLLAAVYLKAGLPWLALSVAGAGNIVLAVYGLYYFKRVKPELFPSPARFDRQKAKSLLQAGGLFLALQVLAMLGVGSDNLIITRVLGPSQVPLYSVAQKMFYLAIVAQFVLAPLWSAYGEALGRKDFDWIRRTFRKSIFLSAGSGALCALPLLLGGNWLIQRFVSAQLDFPLSLRVGFYAYVLLHCFLGCYTTLFNSGVFLYAQVKILAFATALALLLKIAGMLYYGLEGLLWGHVIGFGLGYLPLAAWTMRRVFSENSLESGRRAALP